MGLGRRMNAKWNPKCGLELIDFLKEFFSLNGYLTWVDQSSNLWYEKFCGKIFNGTLS